ncbi:potassium channel family protein [Pseudoalteromonas spongiae]|uniref:potassium channel family protein n=1 Tax=Pseudoalteromonas spongiae TaxID=298657 RepID=UPI000C2D02F4|nr:potassium channel family protein [Pseudoalteromonas spongiae]
MNLVIKKILVAIRRHIHYVSWTSVVSLLAAHMLLTWVCLFAAKETELLGINQFIYYYIVTTSTVGYGDLSPSSDWGKLFVALVQIPIGLALFGVVLGKVGQSITGLIKASMTGDKDYSGQSEHILIFGYHPSRTRKMINYILADNKRVERRILLAVDEQMTHPFSDNPHVDFVRLSSFTDVDELKRVAIDGADKVIVDGNDDDHTFTTALKISRLVHSSCHISAYFLDESKSEMLREHCKNVESTSSKSVEILVRSMQDPGSSRIQEELLSTLHGDTQFSLEVGGIKQNVKFEVLFFHFKKQFDATILGVAHNRIGEGLDLNPPLEMEIKQGDILHYMSVERVLSDEVDWQSM